MVIDNMRLDFIAEVKRTLRDEFLADQRPGQEALDHEAVAVTRDCVHSALCLLVHLARTHDTDLMTMLVALGRDASTPIEQIIDPGDVGRRVERLILDAGRPTTATAQPARSTA